MAGGAEVGIPEAEGLEVLAFVAGKDQAIPKLCGCAVSKTREERIFLVA